MSGMEFTEVLRGLRESADNQASFDEFWTQGRSAFGGLSAALAITAMEKLLAEPIPLRSLMVSFIGPIPPGNTTTRAEILRQGKNVTQMRADVLVGSEICLQAMGVYGKPRGGMLLSADRAEDPVRRDQGLPFSAHGKRLPAFLTRFEGYWVSDALPFSGTASRQLRLWVRHRDQAEGFAAEKLAAIADVPPPVILSCFEQPPVPASSLTWSLEFVVPPREIRGEWFYLDFFAEAAAAGYTQQSGRIYDENGVLCALSRQCMVYFQKTEDRGQSPEISP